MHLSIYALPSLAVFVEGLLLWRLSNQRLWSRYPYLTSFAFYTFVRDVILFAINRYKPNWFAGVYWRTETICLFLRFLLNWEFLRGVFPRQSTLHNIAWKLLLTVELGVLPALVALSWSRASSIRNLYLYLSPAVEQDLSLAQVLLLLTPAAVAWYYHVPLGRNMRGLGLGLGAYLAVCAVGFASLHVFRGLFPYWRLLSPMTFIGMIAVWLWAFWEYAPSRKIANINEPQNAIWKVEWQQLWARTMKLLRRGVN